MKKITVLRNTDCQCFRKFYKLYCMIPVSKGQKAVRACMIRLLNLVYKKKNPKECADRRNAMDKFPGIFLNRSEF